MVNGFVSFRFDTISTEEYSNWISGCMKNLHESRRPFVTFFHKIITASVNGLGE